MSPLSLRRALAAAAVPLLAAAAARAGAQPNTTDTRLLAQPAVSATQVAFVYAGDLWVARLDGSDVRRLTTADGDEQRPAFSPDGRTIAFSANYDGNTDVYAVPAAGGVPKRLTWHPGDDIVQGFSADGRRVLFTSGRESFTSRFTQLFAVPVDGGMDERLPIPNAARASYSPDGKRIAYNPIAPRFEQWKHYRGGTTSEVWLYDVATHAVEKVPQPQGRSNDVDAQWSGSMVYFRSDRDGEFNVYAYDPGTKQVRALTKHTDYPVLNMGVDPGSGRIAYEQAGYLHLLDAGATAPRKMTIGIATDLRETRPRFVKGDRYIRDAALSPSGARAAFEYRGEIITVPAEKGDARNLTNSAGSNERSPAWSPDGSRIAYVSDANGEYELVVEPQDGRGAAKSYKLAGNGFYSALDWSPDGRKIAYEDNSQSTYVLDLASGAAKRVGGNRIYVPEGLSGMSHAWSPDSRWLAYTVSTQALVNTLFLYDVQQDRSTRVTDGLSEVTEPAFDASGKYLYVFGSTDAGPVQDWFSQASLDYRRTRTIYAIVLRKDLPNPLARESDEERVIVVPDSSARRDSAQRGDSSGGAPRGGNVRLAPPAPRAAPGAATRVDFDGIEYRILALPLQAAELSALKAGEAGQIYYVRTTDGRGELRHYDLAKRKDETLIPQVALYTLSGDRKKVLYRQGQSWFVSPVAKVMPNEGRLAVADVEVRIDPRAEWGQIFNEAWRINRDYFYAPNMHGVDWEANRKKYAPFLADATTKGDVNRIIQWMMSELSVGHHRGGGGDRLNPPANVPGGLLGADYAVDRGRYRITRVYGGLNWTPNLRAPLTEPGVNARAGEYILAVNGVDLRAPTNLYSAFENTAGKIVDLTIGPNADGSGSRTAQVVPIADEGQLRNRAWVEENLRKVDSATGGRVAYVYVPNTAEPGHTYFKRYFYPQAHKDAIIVDERFNGGGQVADYYIDILRRPLVSYWALRYGEDLRTPTASIQGPKAMLIDETAGSGGDLLPWMFRKFQMGPIIGKRTWGGLVGVLGYPVLMDGGTITAPNLAIWTPEEGFTVENVGVPPDIEVEQTPAAVIAGHDPQLERAIEVVMAELKKNPPRTPKRPAYPNKVWGNP
ncbi:MAG TPA: PDZ domain-containing protein [Gemmatimonadaceae bacterium]|nr:PDZ domain-containing protein [Gemmatimonadaceae bacterium]